MDADLSFFIRNPSQQVTMQANNNKFYNANPIKRTKLPLNERSSTEWDLRLDLVNGLDVTSVVKSAQKFKDLFTYCLISGVELGKSRADRPGPKGWFTQEEELHVHIAVVLINPKKRLEVLALFRPTKIGGEYAVPRNTAHTYIGWRLHHNKVATKIGSTDPIWEYGTLPMDAFNAVNGLKIYYIVRNYGTEEDKIKYKGFMDLGIAKKTDDARIRKRKMNEEVDELRKRLKQYEESN